MDRTLKRFRSWVTAYKKWVFGFVALLIAVEGSLLLIYLYGGQDDFYRLTRNIGVWGIGLSVVYMQAITLIMMLTLHKNKLDRCFIWQTQAMALLMYYAFFVIQWPALTLKYPVIISVLWYNIWIDITVSSWFVLYYLYAERFVPIIKEIRLYGWSGWHGLWKMARGFHHPTDP